jgi:hypothetical protein
MKLYTHKALEQFFQDLNIKGRWILKNVDTGTFVFNVDGQRFKINWQGYVSRLTVGKLDISFDDVTYGYQADHHGKFYSFEGYNQILFWLDDNIICTINLKGTRYGKSVC